MAMLNGRDVKSGHVVVSASLDGALELAVTAGVRKREILAVAAKEPKIIETFEWAESISRTFLCWSAPLRTLDSVTESTTEAHGGRNPRRYQHHALSA